MTTHRVDSPVLWAALDIKRQDQGLTWRGLGRELDISASVFTRLQTGEHSIDGGVLVTLLTWLRLTDGIADYITAEDQS